MDFFMPFFAFIRTETMVDSDPVPAVVTDRSPRGTIFVPFHFREGAANVLTNDALDPIAKIPEFKVCAVNVGKITVSQ